jgi:hypothetical protein
MLLGNKEWDNLRLKDRLITWETVDLTMHIKAPGVDIGTIIALRLTQTSILNWINAITSRCNHKSVEISYSN